MCFALRYSANIHSLSKPSTRGFFLSLVQRVVSGLTFHKYITETRNWKRECINNRLHLARKRMHGICSRILSVPGSEQFPQRIARQGHIQSHDAFRQIARERKYLMDYEFGCSCIYWIASVTQGIWGCRCRCNLHSRRERGWGGAACRLAVKRRK